MTVQYKVLLAATSFLALSIAGYSQANHARIVRISYAEGTVQLNHQSAAINSPLVEGSVLTTGDNGFAEVQFEGGNILRVGPNTEMTFSQLARLSWGETLTRLDLEAGEAELSLTGGQTGRFAIGAANKNIQLSRNGRFRVFRSNDEPLELAVWKGEAVVHDSESGADVTVTAQETFVLAADDPQKYELEAGVEADGLDEFSELRDQYLAREYVSNDQTASVVSPPDFVDSCAPIFWSRLPDCYGDFPYPPIGYGVVYIPPYYRHPHHPHPPIIHPPLRAQPVPVKVMRPSPPVIPIRTGRVEPKPPTHLSGDDSFQRSSPPPARDDHQKTVVVGEPVRVEPGKPSQRSFSDDNFQRAASPSQDDRGGGTIVGRKTAAVKEQSTSEDETVNGPRRAESPRPAQPVDPGHASSRSSADHSSSSSSEQGARSAHSIPTHESRASESSRSTYSPPPARSDSGSSHSSEGFSGAGVSHSGGASAPPASAPVSHSSPPSSPPPSSPPSSSQPSSSSGRSH